MSVKHLRGGKVRGALTAFLLAVGVTVAPAADARVHRHNRHHLFHHARAPGIAGGSEYYTNVSGHHVHRPVQAASAPSGASARCGDGSWSFSEHHQGTCSHHGGVARWL